MVGSIRVGFRGPSHLAKALDCGSPSSPVIVRACSGLISGGAFAFTLTRGRADAPSARTVRRRVAYRRLRDELEVGVGARVSLIERRRVVRRPWGGLREGWVRVARIRVEVVAPFPPPPCPCSLRISGGIRSLRPLSACAGPRRRDSPVRFSCRAASNHMIGVLGGCSPLDCASNIARLHDDSKGVTAHG